MIPRDVLFLEENYPYRWLGMVYVQNERSLQAL
jgi:hypothetical protein